MKIKTSEKIIEYIAQKGQITGHDLANHLEISDRGMRKQLSALLAKGVLKKVGKPPRVFYSLKGDKKNSEATKLPADVTKLIEDNYLIITPSGERIEGAEGFAYWCQKNNLNMVKTANEYVRTIHRYSAFKKGGFIDGMKKLKQTFSEVYLDRIYYLDFYSIERFGKTKLGQLLLYGKQSGNKKIIKEIVAIVKPKIERIIKKDHIEAVGFIPWTVKREVQFIRELERGLKLDKTHLEIEKIKTDISVPQKTLSKLADRMENAQTTIIVRDAGRYSNVLLIDDAVGSGATLNEVAKQIKQRGLVKKVIGLSIAGSFKGFDVVSEV